MSVVMVGVDRSALVSFETSPDDFLSSVRLADRGGGEFARTLTLTTEQVPKGVRIYWDMEI